MPASDIEYQYIEDVEDLSAYRPGGYHPIQIDDRLHNRCRIVHKLGHGTFSTAWLALDEQILKYVAVKVGTVDADRREADILSQLRKGVVASRCVEDKASMIPLALDRFNLDGPNGSHPCFVTFPARCSLKDAREASGPRLFRLDVARAMLMVVRVPTRHLGNDYPDLHLGNILLQLPSSLANLSVEQLYANFGAPEPEPVVRLDGKSISSGVPSYAIPPAWLGAASDQISLGEAKLLLNDFGTAFRPSDKSRFESYTPRVIRPPEALSLVDRIIATRDDITAQQVHLQGPLPSKWWHRWEGRPEWFDEAGKPLSNDCDIWTWDRVFEQSIQKPRQSNGMDVINEEEAALLGLLQWMLAWRPEGRPNTEEILNTAWMKKWALPAYEESRKG
ncbi:hypothetical protein CHU98_g8630 [Xylaria longipes]|nr:hypothetical protein CHU98_g8630 [Xylaria longipes]